MTYNKLTNLHCAEQSASVLNNLWLCYCCYLLNKVQPCGWYNYCFYTVDYKGSTHMACLIHTYLAPSYTSPQVSLKQWAYTSKFWDIHLLNSGPTQLINILHLLNSGPTQLINIYTTPVKQWANANILHSGPMQYICETVGLPN